MENIIKTSRDFSKEEVYKMTHNKALNCKDVVGEIYTVSDWMVYEQDDQRGQLREVLCMITDQGNVATVSETFKKSFFDMLTYFELPLTIVVTGGVSKSGRQYVSCELA